MDWLQILERYGLPTLGAGIFWWFIQKQNKYIQDELSKKSIEQKSIIKQNLKNLKEK